MGSGFKLQKTLEEVNSVFQKEEQAEGFTIGPRTPTPDPSEPGLRQGEAVRYRGGIEDSGLRESPNPQAPIPNPVSERHERPTRYVYGEKKK